MPHNCPLYCGQWLELVFSVNGPKPERDTCNVESCAAVLSDADEVHLALLQPRRASRALACLVGCAAICYTAMLGNQWGEKKPDSLGDLLWTQKKLKYLPNFQLYLFCC